MVDGDTPVIVLVEVDDNRSIRAEVGASMAMPMEDAFLNGHI